MLYISTRIPFKKIIKKNNIDIINVMFFIVDVDVDVEKVAVEVEEENEDERV